MRPRLRRPYRLFAAALGCALALAALVFAPGALAASPAFTLTVVPAPSNFALGAANDNEVMAIATNVGGAAAEGDPVVLEVGLPVGYEATSAESRLLTTGGLEVKSPCSIATPTSVACETTAAIPPGRPLEARLGVKLASTPSLNEMQVSVSGGGAQAVSLSRDLPAQSSPVPFGVVTGLNAPLLGADGGSATLAGSHPFQQVVDFGFPLLETTGETGTRLFAGSGSAHEIIVNLPRGLVVNPSATPILCTEFELLGGGCPDASQIGNFNLASVLGDGIGFFYSDVYNMVPPPGYPAEIAFDPSGGNGIFVHVLGSVRSDGDFGIQAIVRDVPALGKNPPFNDYTQLWGDPSADVHTETRGVCTGAVHPPNPLCLIDPGKIPLLTTPPDCSGEPLATEVRADSWEEPGNFKSATYLNSDLQGNPVTLSGCNQLSYEPTLEAKPTSNVADSPTGLDVTVHQPQEQPHLEPLSGRATGELKDATVTLPAGLVANPSQADGLATCSLSQIGYLAEDAEPGIHFSKEPDSCPDASKLGTVEVTTPLLAEYNAEHKREDDPQTGAPKLAPLKGSLYLAQPVKNPFGSLLALYISIDDKRTGTIAKLAGEVEPDPQTGQLTTRFSDNPELPLEDIRLHLFPGARASLVTPPACGTYTTTSTLSPWSAPETPDAHPSSAFQIGASADANPCPDSAAAATKALSFTAGTITPQAGAYSPFVLNLARPDGSQRLSGFDLTLPPGLSGRLAGVATCSDQALAAAEARSGLEEGALEQANPSCPADSRLGSVTVAAGPGPSPLHVAGTTYLAGPYKGAPLSMAVITPAVAGPFDLGVVVVRAALYVEPETARIHAVSDPFPQVVHGIPLDLRSVSVNLDRPSFTINPTSCDTLGFTGAAQTASGQSMPLTERFQVGGCSGLPFKPALSLALKGSVERSSNPRLVATLKAQPGEANIARAQVKLPHAVFLDQGHIRTICTRVQFAADTCPAGSVYGKVEATTPLLGYPLSGSVYLRSSSHELPDLVAKLKGPLSQPIEIDLVGRTDAVKGALRNTFEAVPDAPVSRFRLELFGGKRGLVEMSGGFCAGRKANVQLDGQNGKVYDTRPVVKAKCPKHKRHRRHKHRGGR
jgi:hypothetical protein